MSSVVPGTQDPAVNAATLIPASHLPQALQTAGSRLKSGNASANDAALLQQLQKQLNYLMGVSGLDEKRDDVVMVNPHGRIVEVAGQYVDEWISKPGFRAATPEEEANYRKAIARQTPEYLRRQYRRQLQEEKRLLDDLEADEIDNKVTNEQLLHTHVTESQRTGALNPEQVKELHSHPQIGQPSETPSNAEFKSESKPKTPPKRGSRNTPEEQKDTPDSSDVEDV